MLSACYRPLSRVVAEARLFDSRRFTAATPRQPITKVCYIKTHKTASTTLAAVLSHYARRHNLTMYGSDRLLDLVHINEARVPADIVLPHYGDPEKLVDFSMWEAAYKFYQRVAPGCTFLTIVREPVSHYLSFYSFFHEPLQQHGERTLADFVQNQKNPNILVRDFAIGNDRDMASFMVVRGRGKRGEMGDVNYTPSPAHPSEIRITVQNCAAGGPVCRELGALGPRI